MNAVKVEERPKLFVRFARMWEKGSAYRQSLTPRGLLMNAEKVEERPKLFVLFARMWEKRSAYRQSLTPRVLLMNAVKVEERPNFSYVLQECGRKDQPTDNL